MASDLSIETKSILLRTNDILVLHNDHPVWYSYTVIERGIVSSDYLDKIIAGIEKTFDDAGLKDLLELIYKGELTKLSITPNILFKFKNVQYVVECKASMPFIDRYKYVLELIRRDSGNSSFCRIVSDYPDLEITYSDSNKRITYARHGFVKTVASFDEMADKLSSTSSVEFTLPPPPVFPKIYLHVSDKPGVYRIPNFNPAIHQVIGGKLYSSEKISPVKIFAIDPSDRRSWLSALFWFRATHGADHHYLFVIDKLGGDLEEMYHAYVESLGK